MREFFKVIYLISIGMIFILLIMAYEFPIESEKKIKPDYYHKDSWQRKEINEVIRETKEL